MPAQPAPAKAGAVAVALASTDGTRLKLTADVSRAAPRDSEEATAQFLDLMREAVRCGYLTAVVSFAEMRRLRDAVVATFDWPGISDKRLLKLIARNGYAKTVIRDRSGGKDKRTVSYRLR